MTQKVWLITGCSTGFGRELSKIAAEKGDFVVGTLRKESQIEAFEKLSPGKITALIMDVTNPEQIKEGVKKIIKMHGKIDVLVNNAGYGVLGSVEEVTEEAMQHQFNVNVFGAVRMIKEVLPHMRQERKGHILNITSISGLNGFPGVGIYNGSKFALEGIGEALAAETAHLGIKVTNIEPGPFRTDWAGRSASLFHSEIVDYKESAWKNVQSISGVSGKQVGDPIKAANAMYKITQIENPPIHLPLGASSYKRARIKFNNILEEINKFENIGLPTDYTEEELQTMDN